MFYRIYNIINNMEVFNNMEVKGKFKITSPFVVNHFKESQMVAKAVDLSNNQMVSLNVEVSDDEIVSIVEGAAVDDVFGIKGNVHFSASSKNDKVYTNINIYVTFALCLGQIKFPEF